MMMTRRDDMNSPRGELWEFDALVSVLNALHDPKVITIIDNALQDENVTAGWLTQETTLLLQKAKFQLINHYPQANLKIVS